MKCRPHHVHRAKTPEKPTSQQQHVCIEEKAFHMRNTEACCIDGFIYIQQYVMTPKVPEANEPKSKLSCRSVLDYLSEDAVTQCHRISLVSAALKACPFGLPADMLTEKIAYSIWAEPRSALASSVLLTSSIAEVMRCYNLMCCRCTATESSGRNQALCHSPQGPHLHTSCHPAGRYSEF